MRRGLSTAILAALAGVLLMPISARGFGVITGLSVNPSPAFEYDPVTVTVAGTGTCTVTVGFGDRSSAKSPFNTPLPWSVQHTYRLDGAFILGASGEGCTGRPSVFLRVGLPRPPPPPVDICTLFGCFPTITSLYPDNNWILRPGGSLLILGSGFGEITPQVFLLLYDFNNVFTRIPFTIEASGNYFIGAVISRDLSGFQDQVGQLQVVTALGAVTDPFFVSFEARRDVMQLPAGATTVLSCDQGADTNFCFADFQLSKRSFVLSNAWALHSNVLGFVTGADTYQFTVINGWLFIDPGLLLFGNSVTLSGFNPGGREAFAQVNFSLGLNSEVLYTLQPVIEGPRGVPAR